MTQPNPYARQANFTAFESQYPNTPKSGVSLDAEFNAVGLTLGQLLANIALIQRDDGALHNQIVGVQQLDASALTLIGSHGFTVRGVWVGLTQYNPGDMVVSAGEVYLVMVQHVSDPTNLALDVAANRVAGPIFSSAQVSVLGSSLSGTSGASAVGTANGQTVQQELDFLTASLGGLATFPTGTSAPTAAQLGLTTLAGVVWHDTTTQTLKIRDLADSTWIIIGTFDEVGKTFTPAVTPAAHFSLDTGGVDGVIASPAPAWQSYALHAGDFVIFTAGFTNDGPSQINVSSLGFQGLYRQDGSQLQPGDLQAGGCYIAICQGSRFQLLTYIPPSATVAASTAAAGVVKLATATDIQLADATKALTAAALIALGQSIGSRGYYTLPGGLIVQWGNTTAVTGGGSLAITYPIPFPSLTLGAWLSAGATGPNRDFVNGQTAAGFTLNNGGTDADYYWIAIGK